MSRLTQIDMNLAVFAVDFLLATGLALANHVYTMLDATSLVPWLPCNFAAKFDQILWPRCQAPVSYQGDRCGKILANGKSLGKAVMVRPDCNSLGNHHRCQILEDQPGEPLGITGRKAVEEISQVFI